MGSWFSETKKDPYGTLNPEQVGLNKALGPDITNRATGDYSQFLYPGQLTAPITQGEQDVVNNSARLNAVAGDTFNRIGKYDPASINEQFSNDVFRPTLQNWQNDVAPYLRSTVPAFSSMQGTLLNKSLSTLQNDLLQKRMGYQQQAQVNALNALSGGSSYNANAAKIAAIPREIQQAGLGRDYENFIQANGQKRDSINQALQFLGISTGTAEQESTTFGNILATGQALANISSTLQGNGGNAPPTGQNPSSLGAQTSSFGGGTSPYAGPSSSQLAAPSNQWKLMAMAGA